MQLKLLQEVTGPGIFTMAVGLSPCNRARGRQTRTTVLVTLHPAPGDRRGGEPVAVRLDRTDH